MTSSHQAILLVNMGGPSNIDEIESYLLSIFNDPFILGVPAFLRSGLARLIVALRLKAVKEHYNLIGGSSPLLKLTQGLVQEMYLALKSEANPPTIAYAFRYTSPTIEEGLTSLKSRGIERVLLLPLFPQVTKAMTGSVLVEARRVAGAIGIDLTNLDRWALDSSYVELQRTYLLEGLKKAGPNARVLFVAHGIPQKSVAAGDDYPDQVKANARLLAESLPTGTSWSLAFQSKIGPVKWTEPYLEDTLKELAQKPDPIVIMPLSFVAECLETLYDLDHVARFFLFERGVKTVVRVPAFDADPRFARILLKVTQGAYS